MIRRLNHAVLYVKDAATSARFYVDVLGFEITETMGDGAVFLSASKSDNDHDLGLFTVGGQATPSEASRRTVGLYHLAWEVDTLGELASVRDQLAAAGALHGESDHGASRSLYGRDPDGIEFEVMWEVPLSALDSTLDVFGVAPLDLESDIARFGSDLSRNR